MYCIWGSVTKFCTISIFFIVELRAHPMGLETSTSPSTLLLPGEEFPFELELIGIYLIQGCYSFFFFLFNKPLFEYAWLVKICMVSEKNLREEEIWFALMQTYKKTRKIIVIED